MSCLARDVMQSHVITVDPDLPLLDAHRLLVEEEIGGAPVVDETGRLVGVISSSDLLRAEEEEREGSNRAPSYFTDLLEFSAPHPIDSNDLQDRLGQLVVSEAMTPGGVSVAPDTPIDQVAGLMRRHRIHRVLVLEADRLVGIISSFDLLELLEKDSGRLKAS
jgi:CBS domain-containing protein